jgi:Na+/H+ antiporter NhaD/arsenite permease-like protein
MWLLAVGLLLAMFYVIDRIHFHRAPRKEREHEAWRFDGFLNLLFLAVILGAVFIIKPFFLREGLMLAAALASYLMTQRRFLHIHGKNEFDFHPVKEVVILFAGIFATMMPALDWLGLHAEELLGANPSPAIFYWGTGGLSAVLDNAPTYLGFLSALQGTAGTNEIVELPGQNHLGVLAISVGAVFFGAATYIGNGPNFMVKAIADREKVLMPGFLGFVIKFTLPFLLPVLITIWLLFFRG